MLLLWVTSTHKGINLALFFPTESAYNPQAFFTHAALLIRLSPIVQYSPLLPPVGVWAVSQSQCG